jgi:hypothetical protein
VTCDCGVEQAATYKSDQASREDLNSYFDTQNVVAHKAHKKDFTSAAAKQQLNTIFGNSKSDQMNNKVRKIQKKSVSVCPKPAQCMQGNLTHVSKEGLQEGSLL